MASSINIPKTHLIIGLSPGGAARFGEPRGSSVRAGDTRGAADDEVASSAAHSELERGDCAGFPARTPSPVDVDGGGQPFVWRPQSFRQSGPPVHCHPLGDQIIA